MQLIAFVILLLSLTLFVASLRLLIHFSHASRDSRIEILHRGHIGGCGISMVAIYPTNLTPLRTMLDEELPCSEAVIICDMQRHFAAFGDMVGMYHLVRVNHDKFPLIRTLYRSQHRAFRRIVVIDLPYEHLHDAKHIAHDVASYDNIFYTYGDMIIERGIATYISNLIARKFDERPITIRSIVGGDAVVETAGASSDERRHIMLSDRVLAWRNRDNLWWSATTVAPLILALVAIAYRSIVLLAASVIVEASLLVVLYISCRVVSERGLMATFSTIIDNFYRYFIDKFKIFHYLYKRCERVPLPNIKRKAPTNRTREYNNIQL